MRTSQIEPTRDRYRHLRQLSLLRESIALLEDDPRPEATDYVARARTSAG